MASSHTGHPAEKTSTFRFDMFSNLQHVLDLTALAAWRHESTKPGTILILEELLHQQSEHHTENHVRGQVPPKVNPRPWSQVKSDLAKSMFDRVKRREMRYCYWMGPSSLEKPLFQTATETASAWAGVYRRVHASAQPLCKQEATGSIPVGSIDYAHKSASIPKSSVCRFPRLLGRHAMDRIGG